MANKKDYKKRTSTSRGRAKIKRAHLTWRTHHPGKLQEYRWRNTYGLEPHEYEELLEAQGGGCAICHTRVPGARKKFFSVDHDHSTGVNRGLLCERCNMALGLFQDSSPILEQASAYLKKYRPS